MVIQRAQSIRRLRWKMRMRSPPHPSASNFSAASAAANRSVASSTLSRSLTALMRTYPSPQRPKLLPGVQTTAARSSNVSKYLPEDRLDRSRKGSLPRARRHRGRLPTRARQSCSRPRHRSMHPASEALRTRRPRRFPARAGSPGRQREPASTGTRVPPCPGASRGAECRRSPGSMPRPPFERARRRLRSEMPPTASG
jgi:hypothetical protein